MARFFTTSCLIILATWAATANGDLNHPHAPLKSPSPSPSPSPSHAPKPAKACDDVIYQMASCLSFLSNGGKDTKPSSSCCSGFKSVLNVSPQCICDALRSNTQLGVDLNMTRADALPSECGVAAPPVTKCGLEPPTKPPKKAPTPSKPPAPSSNPEAPAPSPAANAATYSTSASLIVAIVSMLVASSFIISV